MTMALASLGWDATFQAAFTRMTAGVADCRPGRVLRADRGVYTVATVTGPVRASVAGALLAAAAHDPEALPCAGDWLVVRDWPDGRITAEAVLPRRTAVVRRTAGKQASGQVLAANLDIAAVVEPMDPEPDLGRVERLLALAWESGPNLWCWSPRRIWPPIRSRSRDRWRRSPPEWRCCRSAPSTVTGWRRWRR